MEENVEEIHTTNEYNLSRGATNLISKLAPKNTLAGKSLTISETLQLDYDVVEDLKMIKLNNSIY